MGRLAAGNRRPEHGDEQIGVEPLQTNNHSGNTESEHGMDVKTDMSKQHNKAVKQKRRLAYLKRKKVAAKAKRPAPAAAA